MLEDPKQSVREFWEVAFNQGNLDRLDQLLAPDFVIHDLALHKSFHAAGLKRLIQANLKQKLSLRAEVLENLSAEGERVVTRFVLRRAEQGSEASQSASKAAGSEPDASSDQARGTDEPPQAQHASASEFGGGWQDLNGICITRLEAARLVELWISWPEIKPQHTFSGFWRWPPW